MQALPSCPHTPSMNRTAAVALRGASRWQQAAALDMQLCSTRCRAPAAVGRGPASRSRLLTSLQQPGAPARRGLAVQVRSAARHGRSLVATQPADRACRPPMHVSRHLAGFWPPCCLQAYQDAAPSSPWPRQQSVQQQAPAPSSSNGAGAAAAAAPGASQQRQARRRVTAYRGLSASQFQHPLDQQNTALLRALPGLEMVARCVPAWACC